MLRQPMIRKIARRSRAPRQTRARSVGGK